MNNPADKEDSNIKVNYYSSIMNNSPLSNMIQIFYYLLSLFAAYVCFNMNKGFSWSIILALLFSPRYLVYAYAKCGKNIFKLK